MFHLQKRTATAFQSRTLQTLHAREIRLHPFLHVYKSTIGKEYKTCRAEDEEVLRSTAKLRFMIKHYIRSPQAPNLIESECTALYTKYPKYA